MFCYGFKSFDYLCEAKEFVTHEVLDEMIADMDAFIEGLEDIFKVSVKFDHRFQFITNSTKSIRLIHSEVVEEIYLRTERIFKFFKFTEAILSILLLWMLIK